MCPRFAEISRNDEFERLNGDFQRELKPKNLQPEGMGTSGTTYSEFALVILMNQR